MRQNLKISGTIFKAISGFLAVAGAITIIWKVAVYFERKDTKLIDIDKRFEVVIETQTHQSRQIDSMIVKLDLLDDIRRDLNAVKSDQTKIINSLVIHLSKDQNVTKEDLLNFMKDFQTELKKKQREQYVIDSIKIKQMIDTMKMNIKIKVKKL